MEFKENTTLDLCFRMTGISVKTGKREPRVELERTIRSHGLNLAKSRKTQLRE